MNRSLKIIAAFVILTIYPAVHAMPFYCPNTNTDPDGDGWGFENNKSCIVINTHPDTPVCGRNTTDTDGDGWGWESGRSCVIDNVVNTNVVIGGEIIASPQNMPGVRQIQSSDFNTPLYIAVASNGVIYGHRPRNNLLTAMDQTGNILWEVKIDGSNSIDIVQLNSTEEYLIVKMSAGQVASYDIDGTFRWITDTFELIGNMSVTNKSIILQREGWAANGAPELDYKSIVSLDHNGQQLWEFRPTGFLDRYIIGNDGQIYVTVFDGGNGTIHIFDE